ncbi:hypothetical protein AS156_25055 [Bradyrhizobium macuxiense]|uniref:Uncharacterized protein n=1 Tax=Bradyrhizobium macuxiense TaxID=1755647 RepID=A0A109J779_9BRAD|nr:hypothetical protein AS156_25055 [Bradyrhizobium macuxiense]
MLAIPTAAATGARDTAITDRVITAGIIVRITTAPIIPVRAITADIATAGIMVDITAADTTAGIAASRRRGGFGPLFLL